MKRIFEIEYADELGPLWMNESNLLNCLTYTCKNTKFNVIDLTGDEGDPGKALLNTCLDQLQNLQKGKKSCRENALAITKIEEALHWLQHKSSGKIPSQPN